MIHMPSYHELAPPAQQQMIVQTAAKIAPNAIKDIDIELTPADIQAAKQQAQNQLAKQRQAALIHQEPDLSEHQIADLTRGILATLTNPRLLDLTTRLRAESLRQHVLQRHSYCPEQSLSEAQLVEQVRQLQPGQFTGSVLILENQAEQQVMFDVIAKVAAQLMQLNDAKLKQKCEVGCYYNFGKMTIKIKLPVSNFPELKMFKTHKCFHPSGADRTSRECQLSEPVLKETKSITIIGTKVWCADQDDFSENNVPVTIYPDATEVNYQFNCEPGLVATLKEQYQVTALQDDDYFLLRHFKGLAQQEQQVMALQQENAFEITKEVQYTPRFADKPGMMMKRYPSYQGDPKHGQGTLELDEHTIYQGVFTNGKIVKGTLTILNPANNKQPLSRYEGDFQAGAMSNGTLIIYHQKDSAKSSQYTGTFVNELFHGKGVMKYSNGNIYEGEWQQGQRHGQGKMTYCDGSTYSGNWRNGKRHSVIVNQHNIEVANISTMTYATDAKQGIRQRQGLWFDDCEPTSKQVIFYHDGSKYIGSVDAVGRRQAGTLIQYRDGGIKKSTGVWRNNELPDGEILLTLAGDPDVSYKYTGKLAKLRKHGSGTLIETRGLTTVTYVGEWIDDQPGAGMTKYQGEIVRNQPQGFGTMVYHKDGYTYTYNGEWLNGRRQGIGKITFGTASTVYTGEWLDDRLTKIEYPLMPGVKMLYQCKFKQNVPHGEGGLFLDNATIADTATPPTSIVSYEGVWESGDLVNGAIKYKNGMQYTGDIRNRTIYHGQGALVIDGNKIYQGVFQDGKIIQGTLTRLNPANHQQPLSRYEGNFQDGLMHNGTLISYDPQDGAKSSQYVGDFANELFHGQGVMQYSNGNSYEGQWQQGRRHGRGMMKYKNGDSYAGQWQQDERHGKGSMTYHNGSIYDGNWCHDKRHSVVLQQADAEVAEVSIMKYASDAQLGIKQRQSLWFNDHEATDNQAILYDDGSQYLGSVDADGGRKKGTLTRGDQNDIWSYTGVWQKNDLPFGEVLHTSSKGSLKYYGELRALHRHGYGVGYEQKGSNTIITYTGAWLDDQPLHEAFGMQRYQPSEPTVSHIKDGCMYIGGYLKGLRHGDGKLFFNDTGAVCTGVWLQDHLIKMQYWTASKTDTQVLYRCSFIQNISHGYGILFLDDNTATGDINVAIEYRGIWENGQLNSGTITYRNGNTYTGSILNGKPGGDSRKQQIRYWHDTFNMRGGYGVMTCANGDSYAGIWPQPMFDYGYNNLHHPTGYYEVTYANGNKFVGVITAHGPGLGGVFKYPDNHRYKRCEIIKTEVGMSGGGFKGILKYANNDHYCGWLVDAKGDGNVTLADDSQGELTYANGDVYQGDMKNGEQDGIGLLTKRNSDETVTKIRGEWRNGNLIRIVGELASYEVTHGNGNKFVNATDQEFAQGIGGSFIYPAGNNYQKCIIHDRGYNGRVGQGKSEFTGKLIYTNRDIYFGKLVDANRNGVVIPNDQLGKFTYADGGCYIGGVKNGMRHGIGLLTSANHGVVSSFRGEWQNGELIKKLK